MFRKTIFDNHEGWAIEREPSLSMIGKTMIDSHGNRTVEQESWLSMFEKTINVKAERFSNDLIYARLEDDNHEN
jgi:hypothetical protein